MDKSCLVRMESSLNVEKFLQNSQGRILFMRKYVYNIICICIYVLKLLFFVYTKPRQQSVIECIYMEINKFSELCTDFTISLLCSARIHTYTHIQIYRYHRPALIMANNI